MALTFAYQWKHADDAAFTVNVANATNTSTNATYVVASGELLKWFRQTVTATGTGGSTSADSAVYGPIGTLTGALAGHLELASDLIIEWGTGQLSLVPVTPGSFALTPHSPGTLTLTPR